MSNTVKAAYIGGGFLVFVTLLTILSGCLKKESPSQETRANDKSTANTAGRDVINNYGPTPSSVLPTPNPTIEPTVAPSSEPIPVPTDEPTAKPSVKPSNAPGPKPSPPVTSSKGAFTAAAKGLVPLYRDVMGKSIDDTVTVREAFDKSFTDQEVLKAVRNPDYFKNYVRFCYITLPIHHNDWNRWFAQSTSAQKQDFFLQMKKAVFSGKARDFESAANPVVTKINPTFRYSPFIGSAADSIDPEPIRKQLAK